MRSNADFTFGLDSKVIEQKNKERLFLSIAFILMYWSMSAMGRDLFVNPFLLKSEEDFYGKVIPYVRALTCIFAIFVVTASCGLSWALSKVPLMFAPYCLFALVSAFWADDMKVSFRGSITLTMAWIAMPMVIHRLGVVRAVRLSLYFIGVVCILSMLLAVFVPSIGVHQASDLAQAAHAGRWRGLFAHKNGLGPWAAYGSIFLFTHGRFMHANPLFLWFARIAAVCCLLFAGSATSQLMALIVLAGWIGLMGLRRYPPKLVGITFALASLGAGLFIFFFADLIFELINRDSTMTGRTGIWALAYEYIQESPWVGYGFLSTGGDDFLGREKLFFDEAIPGPESGYLNLLMETGIVGAVLFFVPFFIALRNGFEWLKYVRLEDRAALEFLLLVLSSTLFIAITESHSLVATGYDGVMAFTALFALLTTPKSPESVRRSDFRLAKYWDKKKPSGARERAISAGNAAQ